MSSSYVVKYTMNVDSQRPLRWETHRQRSTGRSIMIVFISRLLIRADIELLKTYCS